MKSFVLLYLPLALRFLVWNLISGSSILTRWYFFVNSVNCLGEHSRDCLWLIALTVWGVKYGF